MEEWEYAAKGGQEFNYSGSDNLDEVGWYDGNSKSKTHPVAMLNPNGYGLYDMSGNVNEWCWDSYSSDKRCNSGGSWDYCAGDCNVDDGFLNRAYDRSWFTGFRVVRNTGK